MKTSSFRTFVAFALVGLTAFPAAAKAPFNSRFVEAKPRFGFTTFPDWARLQPIEVDPWAEVDSDGIHPDIHELFDDNVIVDGAMNVNYASGSVSDYSVITEDTGVEVLSMGVANTKSSFESWLAGRDLDNNSTARIIRTSNDLEVARRENQLGILFYIQKPWAVDDGDDLAEQIDEWAETPLRIVQLAYNSSDNVNRLGEEVYYGGGANQNGEPLSDRGLEVADLLLERHLILDVSHMGEASSLDVIDLAKARGLPVLSNHANCKAHRNHRRNKTDDEICAIAQTGGVIGVTPIQFMLQAPGVDASMDDLITHLDHIVNLDCEDDDGEPIDMIRHVAVATDSWVDGWPAGYANFDLLYVDEAMNSVLRWKLFATKLYIDHDYSLSDLERILSKNLLRVYREALPGLRKFDLVAPAQHQVLSSSSVWLDWEPAVAQSVEEPTYNLHIYEKQSDGKWKRVRKITSITQTNRYVTGLDTNRDYRWYVHAKNADGVWVNSGWRYFSN